MRWRGGSAGVPCMSNRGTRLDQWSLFNEKAKTTAWRLSRETYIHAASDTLGQGPSQG